MNGDAAGPQRRLDISPPAAWGEAAPESEPERDGAPPLAILMTNIRLSGRTGTEIAVKEMAIALRERGHRVAVFSPTLGPLARELMAHGVPVTDDIAAVGFTPDIIHGHHNVPTALALTRFAGTPAIFVCHDSALSFDAAIVLDRIGTYVAVDAACRERMVMEGVPEHRIQVIPNAVDIVNFPLRRSWPEAPRTALAVTKSQAPYLGMLRAACAAHDIALEIVGPAVGDVVDDLAARFAAADLVFAWSRSAMEAAATGAAVIACDEFGFGGLLTPDQVEDWPDTALSRRALRLPVSVERLEAEISRYRAEDAARFASLLRANVALDRLVLVMERLYRRTVASFRPEPRHADRDARILAGFMGRLVPKFGAPSEFEAREAAHAARMRRIDDWFSLHDPRDDRAGSDGITFHRGAAGALLLGEGWSGPEDWGVWSDASAAELFLPASCIARWDGWIAFRCGHYVPRSAGPEALRIVELHVEGLEPTVWHFTRADYIDPEAPPRCLRVPRSAWPAKGRSLRLRWHLPDAQSILAAGEGSDTRRLGLCLRSIGPAEEDFAASFDTISVRDAADQSV